MNCCPKPIGCGRILPEDEIASWDELTQREFQISGWCTDCQDVVFNEDPWPDDYGWNDEAPF